MDKISKGAPKKDQNFVKEGMKLNISDDDHERVMRMIEDDCKFLEDHDIIDYSLLVGVYEKNRSNLGKSIRFNRILIEKLINRFKRDNLQSTAFGKVDSEASSITNTPRKLMKKRLNLNNPGSSRFKSSNSFAKKRKEERESFEIQKLNSLSLEVRRQLKQRKNRLTS